MSEIIGLITNSEVICWELLRSLLTKLFACVGTRYGEYAARVYISASLSIAFQGFIALVSNVWTSYLMAALNLAVFG